MNFFAVSPSVSACSLLILKNIGDKTKECYLTWKPHVRVERGFFFRSGGTGHFLNMKFVLQE